MPINRIKLDSIEVLVDIIEKLDSDDECLPIYILFRDKVTSEKNKAEALPQKQDLTILEIKTVLLDPTDCIDVEAVIDEYLEFLPETRSMHYIICDLMPGTYGPGTALCADHRFNVVKVPTLMRYGGPQRLETRELVSFPLLSLLFEEDEKDSAQGDG